MKGSSWRCTPTTSWSFVRQCLEAYESVSGGNFPQYMRVLTPFLPRESLPGVGDQAEGALVSRALKALTKPVYAARVGRYDVLHVTTVLSKQLGSV